MRLTGASVRRHDLELREPYTIAYDRVERATNFLLRLEADDGAWGAGCAAPAVDVTGESAEMCEQQLRSFAAELSGRVVEPSLSAMARAGAPDAPAACAALDTALLDLRARAAGLPVWQLLGGRAEPRVTSITLGIEPLEATLERGRAAIAAGFGALKVKGGHDVDEDLQRLFALRRLLGDDVTLVFDANQGYDVEAALRFAAGCGPARLEVLEQPIAATDRSGLACVTAELRAARGGRRDMPAVLADESAIGPDDARALADAGAVDGFVIKLMKAGGIEPALAIDSVAASHGLVCMISCMDEMALAIAAGLHLTHCARTIRWVDLDGHLDLLDDPTSPAVRLRAGLLTTPPGLGLGLDTLPS